MYGTDKKIATIIKKDPRNLSSLSTQNLNKELNSPVMYDGQKNSDIGKEPFPPARH